MKLRPALIFGEHMVLQRLKPIRIWGNSVEGDEVSVTLAGKTEIAKAEDGLWSVTFEAKEALDKTSLEIVSGRTGEKIRFEDVAIGEVWLAGGQSNMEFLMKYDIDFPETKKLASDELLRCFTYPQSAYLGFLELDDCPQAGFWRQWINEEDRSYFAAVPTYMGMMLREKLKVPVGIISCNWGGSPAAAWTSKEELANEPRVKPILDWHEKALKELDWPSYFAASEVKAPKPSAEQLAFTERFMMGEDMSEFFKNFDPSKLPKVDYAPFNPGPRSVVRPSGLYENMLCKVAPYAIKGFLWYQGEDDDARDWAEFYDATMMALIKSWRKLWKEEMPFYQIELAPFRGVGATAAKKYPLIRQQQAKAASGLAEVYDVCILDAGEEYNIHPRHKKMVGERLGRIVMKHSYGDENLVADCPKAIKAYRDEDRIIVIFENAAEGLEIKGDLKKYLSLSHDGETLDYETELNKDRLILKCDLSKAKIKIEFCESNYCVDPLYNSEGNPVFGFTFEV
ncbi:MAG: hypothetical protein IJI46_02485 [Erysipelotrichaceae bacterium]|nr:hypothetical protein [Erysipelotrichaceae bacterium]